jgi:hypothetical protein
MKTMMTMINSNALILVVILLVASTTTMLSWWSKDGGSAFFVDAVPYMILTSTRSKCLSVIAPQSQTITIDYDAPGSYAWV